MTQRQKQIDTLARAIERGLAEQLSKPEPLEAVRGHKLLPSCDLRELPTPAEARTKGSKAKVGLALRSARTGAAFFVVAYEPKLGQVAGICLHRGERHWLNYSVQSMRQATTSWGLPAWERDLGFGTRRLGAALECERRRAQRHLELGLEQSDQRRSRRVSVSAGLADYLEQSEASRSLGQSGAAAPPAADRSSAGEMSEFVRLCLRRLASATSDPLRPDDYGAERAIKRLELPTTTALIAEYGTWGKVLEGAGVATAGESARLGRAMSNAELLGAARQAAQALGTTVLSTHAYDHYREQRAPHLPSSSVLRKWLGPWHEAMAQAGLKVPRTSRRRTSSMPPPAMLAAMRQVKRQLRWLLTPTRYDAFVACLPPEESEQLPDSSEIVDRFGSWEVALEAAGVEQRDQLHPEEPWSASEARRLAALLEAKLRRPVRAEEYARLRERSNRELPSWDALQQLLAS